MNAQSTRGIWTLVLLIGAAIWIGHRSLPVGMEHEGAEAQTEPSGPAQRAGSRGHSAGGVVSVISSTSYSQQVQGWGKQSIRMRTMELRPDTGANHWFAWREFSMPYTHRVLRGRCADDLFVVGEYDGGRTVLERWTFKPVQGSWTLQRPMQIAPLGQPVPPLLPPTLVAVGGTWIPPEHRSGEPTETRRLVDESLDGAPVRALEVDIDGRYVVYVGTDPAGLYRRMLTGPPTQSEDLLHDETTIPKIGDLFLLSFQQHAGMGRVLVCKFGSFGDSRVVLLIDDNNDGLFDPPVEITGLQYRAMFQEDPAAILDNFSSYDL